METLSSHSLALARTNQSKESLRFAEMAWNQAFYKYPLKRNSQNSSIIMAYIAKGIAHRNLGNSELSSEAFDKAELYMKVAGDTFSEYSALLAQERIVLAKYPPL
jgi:hypothetical protein